ncbi:hypothetical protein ppKF707_0451 [Metapseudomonas furukawaii]|uniref:Uncharacterized protein n=1 Tax=Metapseudomonas furukawaii TaxID=1149133 RepID=A0AAD1FDT3_METFU|nr:hypothetical protein ppKF707_0451 [Pseudomonas furukawaii]BAU72314.1 hypothetical protein KF707C_6260 [Pseudomonas furukawaii]
MGGAARFMAWQATGREKSAQGQHGPDKASTDAIDRRPGPA